MIHANGKYSTASRPNETEAWTGSGISPDYLDARVRIRYLTELAERIVGRGAGV